MRCRHGREIQQRWDVSFSAPRSHKVIQALRPQDPNKPRQRESPGPSGFGAREVKEASEKSNQEGGQGEKGGGGDRRRKKGVRLRFFFFWGGGVVWVRVGVRVWVRGQGRGGGACSGSGSGSCFFLEGSVRLRVRVGVKSGSVRTVRVLSKAFKGRQPTEEPSHPNTNSLRKQPVQTLPACFLLIFKRREGAFFANCAELVCKPCLCLGGWVGCPFMTLVDFGICTSAPTRPQKTPFSNLGFQARMTLELASQTHVGALLCLFSTFLSILHQLGMDATTDRLTHSDNAQPLN